MVYFSDDENQKKIIFECLIAFGQVLNKSKVSHFHPDLGQRNSKNNVSKYSWSFLY